MKKRLLTTLGALTILTLPTMALVACGEKTEWEKVGLDKAQWDLWQEYIAQGKVEEV